MTKKQKNSFAFLFGHIASPKKTIVVSRELKIQISRLETKKRAAGHKALRNLFAPLEAAMTGLPLYYELQNEGRRLSPGKEAKFVFRQRVRNNSPLYFTIVRGIKRHALSIEITMPNKTWSDFNTIFFRNASILTAQRTTGFEGRLPDLACMAKIMRRISRKDLSPLRR